MNNILKQIKNIQLRNWLPNLFHFRKQTKTEAIIVRIKSNKLLFISIGVVAGIIVFSLAIWLLSRIYTVLPFYSSQVREDYWQSQTTFYYDPVQAFIYYEDVTLVDLRRQELYKMEHIKNSINVPVLINQDNPQMIQNEKEIVESFKKMSKQKQIIIYGDNRYSLVPAKVALLLNEHNISVKVMTIGWNEFRHLPNFWLPENLWNRFNLSEFLEGEFAIPS